MDKFYLIFGCHCHQPLGNFEGVMEKIYHDSYLPFLDIAARHPKIKIMLHYSGVLLDWISAKHPEFFSLLQNLIQRGQAEVLTGSYYEAILPVIPERDQVEQVKRLTQFLTKSFQVDPRGMWLAERVWEPKLAKTMSEAGIKFALVDDFHFKAASFKEEELLGYFTVEDEGSLVSLFPISERLRYSTPFAKVENTISYIRQMAETHKEPLLVIVDDGEKYGSWPGTKKWVYEDGWLESFFSALEENSEWLKTTTCSEHMKKYAPLGLAYLPINAYFEMGEWALSAERAAEYQSLIEKLKGEGLLEKYKGFLKGGMWRNFFVKYAEANHLHKKMLSLSQSVHRMKSKKNSPQQTRFIEQAKTELLKAQCNDGYWHGVFGGLYLPHLRHALYRHLIQGEKFIDQAVHHKEKKWCDAEQVDIDGDGCPEAVLSNPWLKACFDPQEGGTMVELDYKPGSFNLVNTLARRLEHYHQRISEKLEKKNASPAEEHVSIHDLEKGGQLEKIKARLVYDRYRRACLVDHLLEKDIDIIRFSSFNFSELGDFAGHPYRCSMRKGNEHVQLTLRRKAPLIRKGFFPVEIVKDIRMTYDNPSLEIGYSLVNPSGEQLEFSFGVEFNFSLLAGASPEVTFSFLGEEEEGLMMASSGSKKGVSGITVRNNLENFSLSLHFGREASAWWFPVETISQSEKGFDLTYQSTVFLPRWDVVLPAEREWTAQIMLSVSPLHQSSFDKP